MTHASVYPSSLQPDQWESLVLLTGRMVKVPKVSPVFLLWRGEPPQDTYNKKAILEFHGEPAFAELVILNLFREVGWEGIWIDTFRKSFRTGYWDADPLKDLPASCPAVVRQLLGKWSGAWDVCCWAGAKVVFAESKRHQRDQIRASQTRFLGEALEAGMPLESFLMVEWEAK